MKSIPGTDTSSAVADLREKWPDLNDLDRARAVEAIHLAGMSLRQLAKALGRSESLLRRLLQALQASPHDQELARRGKLSTNELVRRGKAAEARQAAKDRDELEIKAHACGSERLRGYLRLAGRERNRRGLRRTDRRRGTTAAGNSRTGREAATTQSSAERASCRDHSTTGATSVRQQ